MGWGSGGGGGGVTLLMMEDKHINNLHTKVRYIDKTISGQ